jgi:hypothetical protein
MSRFPKFKIDEAPVANVANPANPPAENSNISGISSGVAASTPYRHAVESLPGDCWAIDPLWLCDKHFPLWME